MAEVAAVAEIEGVGPIPAEVARRLACDAHVVLSVESPDGSILDQGRVRRHPTVAQRIEIARRDKGCRFPGCTFTEFTDVHHIRHWVHGGATDLDNLVTLCGRHHRAVHELGWVMKGNANAVRVLHEPARPDREVGAVADLAQDVAGPHRRSGWAAAALMQRMIRLSGGVGDPRGRYVVAPMASVTSCTRGCSWR